jgi:hypothetical protein
MAAIHDDTADAAIGNITASNSVNVFLGLGVPWVIVTLYKHSKVGTQGTHLSALSSTHNPGHSISAGDSSLHACTPGPDAGNLLAAVALPCMTTYTLRL